MKIVTDIEIEGFREKVKNGNLDSNEDSMQKKLNLLFGNRYVVISQKKENTNVYSIADSKKHIRAVVKEVNLEIKDKKYNTEKDIREIKALDRVYENPDSVKVRHGLDHIIELIEYQTEGHNAYNPNLPARIYQITVEADCTLDEYFKKNKPIAEIVEQFIGLCTGLEQLHEQIIHRDIKPKNILMENGKAKFCDMGSACGRGGHTTIGMPGTIDYMAPDLTLSTKSDIFSLGATLYEIITGVQASAKIYGTTDAQKKETECRRKTGKIQVQKVSQASVDIFDNNEENELCEQDQETKKIIMNGRKEIIKDYFDKMQETCGNEYLKEIIKKAMDPEADINLIDPETDVRYQTAREMKTDLIIAQRADKLKTLADRFNKLSNVVNDVVRKSDILEKITKGNIEYNISQIDEAYKAKWQFCNELLNEAGTKYGITHEDLAKSHLLRLYLDSKVLPIFINSMNIYFNKKPAGLGLEKFTKVSEAAKTMEAVDAEKRTHYSNQKKQHIEPRTADEKAKLENWSAQLRDIKRKWNIDLQV